jgi:hypothetical protein
MKPRKTVEELSEYVEKLEKDNIRLRLALRVLVDAVCSKRAHGGFLLREVDAALETLAK